MVKNVMLSKSYCLSQGIQNAMFPLVPRSSIVSHYLSNQLHTYFHEHEIMNLKTGFVGYLGK